MTSKAGEEAGRLTRKLLQAQRVTAGIRVVTEKMERGGRLRIQTECNHRAFSDGADGSCAAGQREERKGSNSG